MTSPEKEEEYNIEEARNKQDDNNHSEEDKNETAQEFILPDSDLFSECLTPRNSTNRVKIYVHLHESGSWDDKGTGHVQLMQRDGVHYIHLKKEDRDEKCHDWKILPESNFVRQQDTLIIFSPNDEYQVALSFQCNDGAEYFWICICSFIKRDPKDIGELELSSDQYSDDEGDEVPCITLSTLQEFLRATVTAQKSAPLRERLIEGIQRSNWLGSLKNVYEMCSDMDDTSSVATVSKIVRNFLLLNRDVVLKLFFNNNENMFTVAQLLSHVPDENNPHDHINYLFQKAAFKQVINITKPETIEKIQRAYRVQYIVDVCLPPRMALAIAQEGESWTGAVDNYLNTLRTEILFNILEEESLKTDLIEPLKYSDIDVNRRKEMVLFLSEYFRMTDDKNLGIFQKRRILRSFLDMGILKALKPSLIAGDYMTRRAVLDIFNFIARFVIKEVYKYIEEETIIVTMEKDVFIVTELINLINFDPEPELQLSKSISLLLRNLLGEIPGNEEVNERQQFLGTFFLLSYRKMLQLIVDAVENGRLIRDNYHASRKIAIIINIISFCITTYPTLSRIQTAQSKVLKAIAAMIKSKNCSLSIAAIKLIKTAVALNCPLLTRHMIEEEVIIDAIKIFCEKFMLVNNLYNSSFLEFFEFIARGNFEDVVIHVVTHFGEQFDTLTYCSTFTLLRARYNRIISSKPPQPSAKASLEEDLYFSDEGSATDESGDSNEAKENIDDTQFMPRAKVQISEETPFTNPSVRPPTPLRITIKNTLKDDNRKEDIEPIAPIRLVAYDELSDSDSDSNEEESKQIKKEEVKTETNQRNDIEKETENLPTNTELPAEQRGKKRRSSTTEDTEVVLSKRSNVGEISI